MYVEPFESNPEILRGLEATPVTYLDMLQHFSGQALVGILANPERGAMNPEAVAKECVAMARALIVESSRP